MNQSEIDAFLAIIESGSLTKAAERLYLTQSTLSSRLDSLERELGAPLLIRKKGIRRVQLTEAGKRMVPVAEKWKKLWQETREAIWREERQTMFLSTIQSVQTYLMGPVYREFLNRADDCDMCILALESRDTYKLIESGELEAGLIANPGYSRTVASIPLFKEPMCFVCGKGSSYQGTVHPSSLSVRNEIYLEWHPEFVMWHTYWFGDGRRCRVETDNMQLLEQLIEQDEYWTVLPRSAALSMEGRMAVKLLPMEDGPEDRVVYMLLKNKKECPEPVKLLIQMLKGYLEQLGIQWIAAENMDEVTDGDEYGQKKDIIC